MDHGESNFHEPVLLSEVLDLMRPTPGGTYLDGTLGGGGHARALLEASSPGGELWGTDLDEDAISYCRGLEEEFGGRVHLFRDNYARICANMKGKTFDGALLDLGVSSLQIDSSEKGFSYSKNSPLDMRYDRRSGLRADAVLNTYVETDLAKIFFKYGEERYSRRIARAIVMERNAGAIVESRRLAEIITGVIPGDHSQKTVARVFQALRIVVNGELDSLEKGLLSIFERLKDGGRLLVISYHSLEDRMVKRYFKHLEADCVCPADFPQCNCDKVSEAEILTRKPLRASDEEVRANPRARSAKLRGVRKVVDRG